MFRCLIYIAAGLMTVLSLNAQVRIMKPVKKGKPMTTRLGIYGGISNSVLLLERNTLQDNSALGYHFGLVYGINRLFRVSVEHTRYRSTDILPTWVDIHANTTEVNVHAVANLKEWRLTFYPIGGISYNVFDGFFTGQNDYLRLTALYGKNTNVRSKWIGLNVGTGLEIRIRPVTLFGEFKLRIGSSESYQLNIMDVCFSTGLRYNLRVPTVYKLFKGTRSRYLLDTADDEF